jgi:hypothetical protein
MYTIGHKNVLEAMKDFNLKDNQRSLKQKASMVVHACNTSTKEEEYDYSNHIF